MLLTPAQIKPKSFESRRNSFFTRGGCVSCLCCFYMQPYQYPNLSEGADRVGGQLRGDKEWPFSGVTKSGRVWRKVPESDARSVGSAFSLLLRLSSFSGPSYVGSEMCIRDSFSGVTKSGRVWRKVPESDARSVFQCVFSWIRLRQQ